MCVLLFDSEEKHGRSSRQRRSLLQYWGQAADIPVLVRCLPTSRNWWCLLGGDGGTMPFTGLGWIQPCGSHAATETQLHVSVDAGQVNRACSSSTEFTTKGNDQSLQMLIQMSGYPYLFLLTIFHRGPLISSLALCVHIWGGFFSFLINLWL